jgi:hypothetical protein
MIEDHFLVKFFEVGELGIHLKKLIAF